MDAKPEPEAPVPVALATSVVPPIVPPEMLDMKREPEPIVTGLPSVFDPLPDSPKEEKPVLPLQPLPHPDGNVLHKLLFKQNICVRINN